MHSWSVSENTWPHNIILQAEVDYDSEIGSEAWNIPSGDFQTPTHFTGHLWVPISGTGFTWLWPLCYWCLDCCFIDFHVSMQQRRRDLRGGSDATTEKCKSVLTTQTLWFTDLKGGMRKGERERNIETQRERLFYWRSEGLNVRCNSLEHECQTGARVFLHIRGFVSHASVQQITLHAIHNAVLQSDNWNKH